MLGMRPGLADDSTEQAPASSANNRGVVISASWLRTGSSQSRALALSRLVDREAVGAPVDRRIRFSSSTRTIKSLAGHDSAACGM